MPQGVQVWDTTGTLVLDTSTLVGIALGAGTTTLSNGSLSVPGLAIGTPFVIATAATVTANSAPPAVWVVGTTIYWEFPPSTQGTKVVANFVYGVR